MSIYRYPGASDIAEIRFRYTNNRSTVALLVAKDGADSGRLAKIRSALQAAGWQCVPAWAEERQVLQVTGFKDAAKLNSLLLGQHFAEGTPQIMPEASDHPKRSLRSLLQHTSLSAAACLNLIGDVGLLHSGISHKNPYHTVAGALFTSGATSAAFFGGVKSERQVNDLLDHTAGFLEEQAIDIPQDSALYAATKHDGSSVAKFLHRNAAQTMLGFYTAGAGAMLVGGLMKRDPISGKLNPMKIAYGVNSLGVKTASLLLPEKPKAERKRERERPRNFISRAYHWVKDEPMHLFGVGSFFSDMYLLGAAWIDHKANPTAKVDKGMWVTTGAYLVADALAGISSKNPANAEGAFSPGEERRIAAMTAETIIRRPEAERDALVNQVAGFLSQQPEMVGQSGKISRAVGEQVKHMADNPWAKRVVATPASVAEAQPVRT